MLRRIATLGLCAWSCGCSAVLAFDELSSDGTGGSGPTNAASTSTGASSTGGAAGPGGSGGAGGSGGSTSTGAGGAVPPGYSSVVLADGPLGYWRLGEASPPEAKDEVTPGHPGTYV